MKALLVTIILLFVPSYASAINLHVNILVSVKVKDEIIYTDAKDGAKLYLVVKDVYKNNTVKDILDKRLFAYSITVVKSDYNTTIYGDYLVNLNSLSDDEYYIISEYDKKISDFNTSFR